MDVLYERLYLVSGLDVLDLVQNDQFVVCKEIVVVELREKFRLIVLKRIELRDIALPYLRTDILYCVFLQTLLRSEKKIGMTHGYLLY